MTTYSFRMPDIGEGVAEAELVEWFVTVGQQVELDQSIAELLTDKASVELPSPVAGTVRELRYAAGDMVPVGAELLVFDVEGAAAPAATVAPESSPPAPSPAPSPAPASAPSGAVDDERRPLASPSLRRRAFEAGIDLRDVRGTGPGGRIEHADLDAVLRGVEHAPAVGHRAPDTRVDEIPVLGLRRAIAEHMSRAKSRIPHITYVEEADVTELERLRASLNDRFGASHAHLTLLPFIVRAIVCSVAEHPDVNARFDDDAGIVRRYGAVHVGIATQTPRGLLVPVVRHAETADLWMLATEITRLSTAAVEGNLGRDELADSTITVTSLGPLGGLVTTPVINYPEVAVVGVNKMQTRPVWDGNAFVPRTMMNLSSGFDHRIIDGWDAARFVQRVKAFLELPATMFLEPPRVTELHCAVLVLGGGPGGYTAAIRAGELGLDTVLVEAAEIGGTCLNVGCIPSKALLHVADAYAESTARAQGQTPFGLTAGSPVLDFAQTTQWIASVVGGLDAGVERLLAQAHVRRIRGWGRCVDGKTVVVERFDAGNGTEGPLTITTEHLVLATGSRPVDLSSLPFGGRVVSSDAVFALDRVPERLVVVGGGYIGIELGSAFAKLGAAVTVVESTARILPGFDDELARPLSRALARSGVEVLTETSVHGLSGDGDRVVARHDDSSSIELPADLVLVTVGRAPATERWGLEELDLERSGPFVRIDATCRTSMAGVYAIGDLSGEPMLAHRAMAQGQLVAEVLAGRRRVWDSVCVPAVVFTDPEIVSVGVDPATARASGTEVVVGRFPFSASGRALATDAADGFVRVVARADDHVLLGIQGVGTAISELAAEFALALEMGARLEDIAATIHAHPTRSEAFQEAAVNALGDGHGARHR